VSVEVENAAVAPLRAMAPSDVVPSKNSTCPVKPATVEATVAVNVTLAPTFEGLPDDTIAVLVEALSTT
jgi:hypothetical protein